MGNLSRFMTGNCLVCGARRVRGFHLEEWCPNEDNHHKVKSPDLEVLYVTLPKKLLYRSGETILPMFWTTTLEMVRRAATAKHQIWSAVKREGLFELQEFIEFGE